MDAYDCIITKLDLRVFDSAREVPADAKLRILEAARSTGSAMNSQHWRFILVEDRNRLKKLGEDSTTGQWISNSNFAVIVLTEEKHSFHLIDAGRVVQDMQLAAWNQSIVSCIYTGVDQNALRRDFNVPGNMVASVIVGFGYPAKKVSGRHKKRKLLHELVSKETFGRTFDSDNLTA